jgi:hypothetical protein
VAVLPNVGRLWSLARQLEDLFQLQSQMKEGIGAIDVRLRAIEDRLLRIEAEAPQLITEARSAAGAAASATSGAALNELVTRLTRVEVRLENLEGAGVRPSHPSPRLGATRKGGRKKAPNDK